MSSCTKLAIAFILSKVDGADAVKDATFCLMSGEVSCRPLSRFEYHDPMSCQLLNPLFPGPPGGNSDTIIWPRSPRMGGISISSRRPFTSDTVHCHRLFPAATGFTSA